MTYLNLNLTTACPVLPENEISLIYYTKNICTGCDTTTPHFQEMKERLKHENYEIKIRSINCDNCNCYQRNIIALPSLILYDGGIEAGRTAGSKTYDEMVQFVLENTDISKETLTQVMSEGKVLRFYERDFYEQLSGPHIILFYGRKSDPIRDTLKQIANTYNGKVTVAEISKKNASNISVRYNINYYPSVMALYDGIQTFYSDGNDYDRLEKFIDKLIRPSFNELTLERFLKIQDTTTMKVGDINDDNDSNIIKDGSSITNNKDDKDSKDNNNKDITVKSFESQYKSDIQSGEPFFIALSHDLQLTNYYFKSKSHEYKTRTTIFRSSDPKLFSRIGIFPSHDKSLPDEDRLIFCVFKDAKFHRYPHKLDSEEDLITWIFHSHFPHLTRLGNYNFQQVFHGIKPVLLLVTENERYDNLLEGIAKKLSVGLPYLDILFATIDTDKFPTFISSLLPNLDTPTMLIYNPLKKLFYHRKIDFNNAFFEQLVRLVDDYTNNKLNVYTGVYGYNSYSYINIRIILVALIIIIGGIIGVWWYMRIKSGERKRYC